MASRFWIVLVLGVVAAVLWLFPGTGSDCGDLEACQRSVALDVSALDPDVDDWVPQSRGVTLSPDGTEVAVVVASEELNEFRLATFSVADGTLFAVYENGDQNYVENPVSYTHLTLPTTPYV